MINIQTPTVLNVLFGATQRLEGLLQLYPESYFTQLKNKMQLNATSTQDWCLQETNNAQRINQHLFQLLFQYFSREKLAH